jgi:Fe2+ transport system protein B
MVFITGIAGQLFRDQSLTVTFALAFSLVVALTLTDVGRRQGRSIDSAELARRLGCPVIPVATPRGEGLAALKDAILAAPAAGPPRPLPLPADPAHAHRPAAARAAIARYAAIERLLAGITTHSRPAGRLPEDRIDRLLTHRLWGTLAFDVVGQGPAWLRHTQFAAQKAKDAIVDRFRERSGTRPSVDLSSPDLRLSLSLGRERASLGIDLSG